MKQAAFIWKALFHVGCEYAMIFPLLYLFTTLMPPPMPLVFLLSVLVFAILGVLTRRLIPIPWLQLAIGLPLSIVLALFLGLTFGSRADPNTYVLPAVIAPLIFYRGKQHAQNDWNAILPTYAPSFIMVLNFIVIALSNYLSELSRATPVITAGGIVSLFVSFFAMNYINRQNLADDQRGNEGSATAVSRSLSTQNHILLGILLVLGLLLSSMPWLLTAAQFLMRGVMQVIGWIFKQLLAFSPVPSGDPLEAEPEDAIGLFSPAPTNPFWDQFFTVLVYIAATIATIGLIFLVILAIRKAVQLFNAILHNMLVQKGLLSSGDNTFEDTNESIIKLRDLPRRYYDGLKNRLSSLKNRKRWNDLTTESERVRYLYRHSLKRAEKSGYQHKQSYTPHEALGEASQDLPQIQPVRDDLSAAYDIARYAECEPPAGSAARMKKNSGL